MNDHRKPKICLTIAGLDPSGGAGVIADVKTFSAFECFATAVITSVTFQNTQGVYGADHQTAESVRAQIEPILDDFDVVALKTGMLPTREIIEEVAEIIKEGELRNIVVDPVVRSTSGFDLIDDSALNALTENLFPLADLVTPNIPEAERIGRGFVESETDVWKAAKIMQSLGAKNVLIKGGHLETVKNDKKMAMDYLFIDDELEIFEREFIETNATHGTGCTLAAAITANLAIGKSLSESVGIAKQFVANAIKNAPDIGKGNSPIGISRSLLK